MVSLVIQSQITNHHPSRSIIDARLIYREDCYICLFLNPVMSLDERERRRKSGLIDRATYLRTMFIDEILDEHAISYDSSPPSRPASRKYHNTYVISLGAGLDTRPFRLRYEPHIGNYIEFDLNPVIAKKRRAMRDLDDSLENFYNYHVFSVDLDLESGIREVIRVVKRLVPHNAERVIVLAECIFMFLQPQNVGRLLEGLSMAGSWSIILVGFEPILGGPDDPFGRAILENLARRRLPLDWLRTIRTPADLEAFMKRHLLRGDYQVDLVTLDQAEGLLDEHERQMLQEQCVLDDPEEWDTLCRHYILYKCHLPTNRSSRD